jgi:ABC-2 type transport system permease protein
MDNKIFVVAKREYLERVRTRAFIITTLLIPVLMAGVVLVPAYIAAKSKPSGSLRKIRILDATGTGVGTRIVQTIRSDSSVADSVSGPFLVTVSAAQLKAAEDSAVAEVMKPKSLAGYLVLDDSTMVANRARYVGRNATTIADMDRLRNAVRQSVMVERLETSGVNKETIEQVAKSSFQLPTQKLDEKGKGGSGVAGLLAGVMIGIMLLMSIIIHGQNVMRGVLEEKTTRVAEIVISSIKPEALLAGKVLGVGAVGLTQIFAWLLLSGYTTSFFGPIVMKAAGGGATVAAAAGANAPLAGAFGGIPYGVLGASIAFFLVGFVFYATLYAAVGSMVNSEQEAQQAATPVMLLLMSGWIFFNPVLLAPNSTLAVVLSWLPWTSPIMMPIRMGLTSVAPASVAGSLVVCVLGSLAAVWLAARIYRVGMLMYGKKPTMAEVAKWIRYA